MEDNTAHIFGLSPVTIAFIGIVVASAGIIIYHFILVLWYSRSRDQLTQDQILPQDSITGVQDLPGSFQNSIASLIPTCKYTNDIALVSKSEDVACAVCLNEFRDGEEVKDLRFCLNVCIHFMFLVSICGCSLTRIAHFVGPTWVSHRQPTTSQNLTPFSYRLLVNHSEKSDLAS